MPRKGIPIPVLRALEAAATALVCRLVELAAEWWWERLHPEEDDEPEDGETCKG